MLTIGKDRSFIHCELFAEAMSLTPDYLVTVLTSESGVHWYVLGKAIRQKDGWIVPLQLVDHPQGKGTIRDFVVREDGTLS